jgi:hypothetical protein
MARYAMSVLTTGTANAAAAWEIRTSANVRARLMEMGVFLNAATASLIGLGRPAAIGITPTTPVDFLPEDSADPTVASQVQSALAWATGPTAPAQFLRRIGLPAAIGNGVIWTWPAGLVIPVSSSIVLWNLQLNSALQAYAVIDE